ncbi:hypothetical protein [Stenotrophomonas maltophilia]
MQKIRMEVFHDGEAWRCRTIHSTGTETYAGVWEASVDALAFAVRSAKAGERDGKGSYEIYREWGGSFSRYEFDSEQTS